MISSFRARNAMRLDEFIPFIVPVVMYLFGGNDSFIDALKMFIAIIMFAGFYFSVVGINASHHAEVLYDVDLLR